MPSTGRILVDGRGEGSGFPITPRLVLTARHCLKERGEEALLYRDGGRDVKVETVESNEQLDVAVLRLAEDVESTLTPSCAISDEYWRVDSQPLSNDPMLSGRITTTQYQIRNQQGKDVRVIQMLVDQRLDSHSGYSGSAVTSPPGSSFVVGVLVEQVVLRRRVLPGETASASNVLYAVGIEDVVEAFGLEAQGVVARRSSTTAASPTPAAIVERVSGLRVATTVEENWRDRDDPIAELRRTLLDGQHRVISIVGRRGVGKSALAAKVLAEFEQPDADRDPSQDLRPLVYLSSARGDVTLAAVYEAIAQIWPPEIRERLAARWQSAGVDGLANLWDELRDHRPVLVLDNLDDLQQPMTHEVCDPELVALITSACFTNRKPTIVTTSQHPINHRDLAGRVRVIELSEGLRNDDAVAVIRTSAAQGTAVLGPISDADLATAAARVDGRPRALQKLAVMLETRPRRIHQLLASDALPDELVQELVSTTYVAMSAQDQLVMQILALAAAPLTAEDVGALLEGLLDGASVETAVGALIGAGEISEHADNGVLVLHPLDADHIRGVLIEGDRERQVLLDTRLADWWAGRRAPLDAWRTLNDAEPSKREYAHRWRAGDHATALAALAVAAECLSRCGASSVVEDAVAKARQQLHETDALGHFYAEVCDARREYYVGSLDESLAGLHRARDMAQRVGLPEVVTDLDLWIGSAHRQRNDPEAAITVLQAIADAPPDAPATLTERRVALFELGLAHLYFDQADRAGRVAARLEELVGADDSALMRAYCSNLMALAAIAARDYDAAEQAANDAIAYYAQTMSWANRGYMENVKALALLGRDDVRGAAAALESALGIAAENQLDRMYGLCATNLAWARLGATDHEAARLAAETAGDRLTSNGITIAASAYALAEAIRSGPGRPRDEVRNTLTHASDLAIGNPDIYLPSDAFLDAAADALAAGPRA